MRRSLLVAAALTALAAVSAAPAVADGTYHSAHVLLSPMTGTSGGSGFVENAHANGPNVYAHEQYQLQHAVPDTDYTVTLHIYLGDPTCAPATVPVELDSAVLTTNAAGNASGSKVFTPAEAAGLPTGVPHGVIWTMTGTSGSYTSGCETILLD